MSHRFRVWAPEAQKVTVTADDAEHPMQDDGDGWWVATVEEAGAGTRYGFGIDGAPPLKDPRSVRQPDGPHGLSEVYDHEAFAWTDDLWHGRPWIGNVIYELHVGTFTREGTFDAAIARLPHIVELGATAIEVMPINGFDGDRGWGYDGVDLFAAHEPYGGPDGFKRFVDAAHAHGLAVVLDVVYNHLGPSGNVLMKYGPYFTDAHETPWGRAVNLDQEGSAEVRAFFIDNAVQWLRDFHCDGLRLDAVHALVDTSEPSFLTELSRTVAELSAITGRTAWLIAESDLNEPSLVAPREAGGVGLDAMWADDLHHSVHTLLTGELDGYYEDFGSYSDLMQCWTRGYCYAERFSKHRDKVVGRPLPEGTSASHVVVALQNHDQIGNRAVGDRLSHSITVELAMVGAAIVLLAPMTPLLFMGEEWAAQTPWQFFAAHTDPELQEAVRTGRRREFAAFGWDPAAVPDPEDPQTARASTLDWDELDTDAGATMLDWYRTLLNLRRTEPDLADGRLDRASADGDDAARGLALRRGTIVLAVNLSDVRQSVPVGGAVLEVLAASSPGYGFGPGDVTLEGQSVAVVRLVSASG
ncbi:MAG TPA: malto-oligosyltrehalose trehalohydrolase [Mycobacteriales bacterium]|nr:malto-oligosyltrehalose trehalohydrolase [Mycobacteriales bacterium]